jgi:thioredoxin reductase (NADPH)
MGPELMGRMREQAQRFGAEFLTEKVTSVDFSERPFRVWVRDAEYQAETIIVSTGAQSLMLGLEAEARLLSHGLSTCATCDGFFFRGQRVAVIGGGNTAVEEALYLSNIAAHVTLVHRRDKLRSEKILQDRLFERQRAGVVDIVWNHNVQEVLGNDSGVTGMRLEATEGGATRDVNVAGVFIAVGHTPNTQIFEGQLDMRGGYIVVRSGAEGNATATSVPGVFAAGDVADHVYRQAVTSAGTGCMAALDADKYLEQFDAAH